MGDQCCFFKFQQAAFSLMVLNVCLNYGFADDDAKPARVEKTPRANFTLRDEQQKQLARTVDRGHEFLVTQQKLALYLR